MAADYLALSISLFSLSISYAGYKNSKRKTDDDLRVNKELAQARLMEIARLVYYTPQLPSEPTTLGQYLAWTQARRDDLIDRVSRAFPNAQPEVMTLVLTLTGLHGLAEELAKADPHAEVNELDVKHWAEWIDAVKRQLEQLEEVTQINLWILPSFRRRPK